MKRFLLFFFIIIHITGKSESATYFFSTVSGDDSRSSIEAKNPDTPWKTLDKLNTVFKSLQPGDSVLLKRGEVFYGSIFISKSGTKEKPLLVGSYGNGHRPVISSLISLVDWVDLGEGIYESSHALLGSKINVLLLDNEIQEMGRFPNSEEANGGYLIIESIESNNSLSSSGLTPYTDWTGAEVVIRKGQFTIDRHPVTSNAGTSVNFTPLKGTYDVQKDYGFFMQDHPGTLDKLGEWHHDQSSKKVKMFFGDQHPSTFNIQVSTIEDLVTIVPNTEYVHLDNLCLQGANRNAIFLEQGNNFELRKLDIEFSGENGIKARNFTSLTIENSNVKYSNNNGIDLLQNTSHATIVNNRIEFTSLFKGMGQSGVGNGYGIQASSDNAHVEFNQVLHTGYIGIRFGGNHSKILHNYIDDFCLIKDDGAGIYTWTGPTNDEYEGRIISGNIVLNGKGSKEGTPLPKIYKSAAEGIYIDDNASGIEISHNTVANNSSKGLFIHNARDLVIKNNTFFNNQFQIFISQDAPNSPIKNNVATDNIFLSKYPHQNAISLHSNMADLEKMADFENNFFVGQENQLLVLSQKTNATDMRVSNAYDLEGWKKAFGNDSLSKKINLNIPPYKVHKLIEENRYQNGSFEEKIDGLNWFSPSKNMDISWSEEGNLDGGSVKVSSKGLSLVIVGSGPVDKEKHYILRFTARADREESLKVYLRQTGSPYHNISETTAVRVGENRGEYEIRFSSPTTASHSSFVFESGSEQLTYWLDNLQFYEAEVEVPDPNEYIRFEFNASKENKTIHLEEKYVDVENITYENNLVLPPYSSIILFKDKNSLIN